MSLFSTTAVFVLIFVILHMFVQIFINEKKVPQDTQDNNQLMNFLMRSV